MEVPNQIYITLNTTYYNTLGSEWQNLIAEITWQVDGTSSFSLDTAKETYDMEIKNQFGYEEIMKIGLMYVSDYGYGASPEKWTLALNSTSSNYGTDNWLYLGNDEWTISRRVERIANVFILYSDYGGYVYYGNVIYALAVRPSFYLESSVEYVSGSGTQSDPFRIA